MGCYSIGYHNTQYKERCYKTYLVTFINEIIWYTKGKLLHNMAHIKNVDPITKEVISLPIGNDDAGGGQNPPIPDTAGANALLILAPQLILIQVHQLLLMTCHHHFLYL